MRRAARPAAKRPGAGVAIDTARLVRMRQEALLSRAQLAALMTRNGYSITPDAIAKIENRKRRPKTSTLSRLCEALDCLPEDLLPSPDAKPVTCPKCEARFGHEPGCPDAT